MSNIQRQTVGIRGIMNFIFLFFLCGQAISFFGEEVNGFLFATIYFAIVPFVAVVILITNIFYFAKTREARGVVAALIFFAGYGLLLWKKPLFGSAAFFISDYREVHWVARIATLALTFSTYIFFLGQLRGWS